MAGFSEQSSEQSEAALRAVVERLVSRFGGEGATQAARVRQAVAIEADRFRDVRVHAFVPILVERAALARLETATGTI